MTTSKSHVCSNKKGNDGVTLIDNGDKDCSTKSFDLYTRYSAKIGKETEKIEKLKQMVRITSIKYS